MTTTTQDFRFIAELVERESAILLEERQKYLVEARLKPLARNEGIGDLQALVRALRARPHSPLAAKVVDAMTTNETSFYRNQHPFEALEQVVLPAVVRARAAERTVRIWCAAASSGQEPYTRAMVAKRVLPADYTLEILATDLSSEMLERCRSGSYTQFEVNRGLPEADRRRWFVHDGLRWRVKDELKDVSDFQQLNLIKPWPRDMGPFDVVFVRNVLIYFDDAVKSRVLASTRRVLNRDGYLFLGTTETTLRLDDRFHKVEVGPSSCFRQL